MQLTAISDFLDAAWPPTAEVTHDFHSGKDKIPMQHGQAVRLTTLQAVRGTGALMVVLFHSTGMLQAPPIIFRYLFGWGYCGVDFFFVLSGFILLYVHYFQIGHVENLGSYLGKRFSRIFPAYWSVLAFLIPACFLVRGLVTPEKKALRYIAASFFLVPQWDPLLGVAWSLSCEIFFYLLFAVLIVNRKAFVTAALVWLGFIGTNFVHGLPAPLDFLCQARVLEFFAGMCIAWAVRKGFRFPTLWGLALITSGISICALAGYTQIARGFGGNVYPLWFGFAAVMIISSLVSLELQNVVCAGRTFLLLGDASYAIYLVHYPVLIVMFRLLPRHAPLYGNWFLAAGMAVFAGIAFHLLIEKHVCEGTRRLAERRRKIQPTPSPRHGSCQVPA